MDILNFISWLKSKRQVTTVDASQTLIPLGLKDARRSDGYLPGAISVDDLLALSPGLPSFIQSNETNKTLWNNGSGNEITTLSFGENSLAMNINGDYNTSIGTSALMSNTTGRVNTALGVNALNGLTTGTTNTALGAFSLRNLTTGSGNIAIGYETGVNTSTGSYNVIIGVNAKAVSSTSYSVVIGNNAESTIDNELVIGAAGGYRLGVITTEALTPTIAWKIKINGVNYKIPLQIA